MVGAALPPAPAPTLEFAFTPELEPELPGAEGTGTPSFNAWLVDNEARDIRGDGDGAGDEPAV